MEYSMVKEMKVKAPELMELASRLFKEGFEVVVAEGKDGSIALIVTKAAEIGRSTFT